MIVPYDTANVLQQQGMRNWGVEEGVQEKQL
jgi:hypothetical protein